jgi:hypothetical protein
MLFFGRSVSFLGNAMAPIAFAFAVLDPTGSAGDLGSVPAARSLLTVALPLTGEVWADRRPSARCGRRSRRTSFSPPTRCRASP